MGKAVPQCCGVFKLAKNIYCYIIFVSINQLKCLKRKKMSTVPFSLQQSLIVGNKTWTISVCFPIKSKC